MSHGKYLSLEEARNSDDLKRFAKEHPSKVDRIRFFQILDAAASPKTPPEGDQTSDEETS